MSRSRRLSDAEIEIWLQVVSTVVPRPDAVVPTPTPQPAEPQASAPASPPPPRPKPAPPRQPTAASYTPPVSLPKKPPLAGLERRYKKRVAGGRIVIDDVLDLHGMTQAEAHGALTHFLHRAQARGAKLVLVVTGKGGLNRTRLQEAETGVLRRTVPHWLRDRGLRHVVLGFEEAARTHGGAGALYIRLRQRGIGD